MSNRRLIRHGPGVLMAFLLLATLVPTSNAQVAPPPLAGTGAVNGIANLPADVQQNVSNLTLGGTALNCTSLSSNVGRWGFTNVPAGVIVQHYAFKPNYAPHSDTFTVVANVGGPPAASLPIQHDFSLALQV